MKQKILILIAITTGFFLSSAQTLTSSNIWYDVMPNGAKADSLLTQKGFKLKYSGPKKMGGNLACYFNKKFDEWLFINDNEQGKTTQISYLLPTLKKYQKNQTEKKLLLMGEEVNPLGKTYQEGKIYYHLTYTFEKRETPSAKN
ncbi:hypothetical protein [Chryseobacterium oncorhynchi]|uniref:Uncharacterized protein n=1 Tax=Chryseobacterium oncorhynchi TaxID=741074 RepID=A0A316X2A4_9FLAO|nr:hypothetical protein [Chryseobacterium oncorhynchi]PWN67831.1 hypothetical protein C1638_004345 [Chryseobacterium oncorhynchi]